MPADETEAREFAHTLRTLVNWANAKEEHPRNPVHALVADFLGDTDQPVVSRTLAPFEQVNLQTALDVWLAEPGRTTDIRGIALPPHHGPVNLQQIVGGEHLHGLRLSAPSLADLPNGPGTTLACLRMALLLVTDGAGRYVVMVCGPHEHEQSLTVEVVGLPVADAQAVLARLDELRVRHNVYRGHVVDVAVTDFGGLALTFAALPATTREQVVLPETVLARVERHTLGISAHRDALLARRQHLKRGLLLYGPPGTGKTHTTRYLVNRMDGYTRLLMTGRALHAIGAVATIARQLAPAVVVLEDVDLVAEDRSFGPGSSPILFDLLDAMDGAAADADLLFLLTTNRADLLEPALAARPGRVDVAVEIALPDAEARGRLLDLYGRDVVTLVDAQRALVVERCEGVTASFLKELVRRAVLEALVADAPTDATHVQRALDDLLDSAQGVTRSLLGVGNEEADVAPIPVGRPPRPGRAYASRLSVRYDA